MLFTLNRLLTKYIEDAPEAICVKAKKALALAVAFLDTEFKAIEILLVITNANPIKLPTQISVIMNGFNFINSLTNNNIMSGNIVR